MINEEDITLFERLRTLSHYQHVASKTALYPGRGTPIGLAYVALKLNGEAGEFAEHVGKAIRDDDLLAIQSHGLSTGYHRGAIVEMSCAIQPLTDDRRRALLREAGDVLWYLAAIATELGVNLDEIATANLVKLQSRAERGKIGGSGDNR